MSVILIAEDEEPLLETLTYVVEAMGHTALPAGNGDTALLLARSRHPDLIVSDYMMPHRSGIELLRALKADEALADIPFVLMSAARPEDRGEATSFLAKPLTLAAFEDEIRKVLGAKAKSATPPAHPNEKAVPSPPVVGRDEYFAWVVHELRNPLSTLRMLASVMRRTAVDAEQERRFGQMIGQLDRMTALVSSVLDASSLASGRVLLSRKPENLGVLLDEMVETWRTLTPDALFALRLPREPVVLSIDRERIRQVVDNLLSNAVKYGVPSRQVEVALTVSPGLATVSVSDFGPGIAAADVPHIFERFRRASEAAGQGHGLGLYIAAELSRLHGGSLSARSTLGKGTTFELALPFGAGKRSGGGC